MSKFFKILVCSALLSIGLDAGGVDFEIESSSDYGGQDLSCPLFFCWKDKVYEIESSVFKPVLKFMEKLLKEANFSGDEGQVEVLRDFFKDEEIRSAIFVGLGEKHEQDFENAETLRRAICQALLKARDLGLGELVLEQKLLDDFKLKPQEFACQVGICGTLAEYKFEKFKQKKAEDKKDWSCTVKIVVDDDAMNETLSGGQRGITIGKAVNWARNLCDLPPNIATPPYIAQQAKEMAEECGLEYKVFSATEGKEMGMGGFWAVQSGSEFEGQFIVLEYKCGKPGAKKVALVGKGVTFDSGGVSLKPWNHMTNMKYDMCGAAAVMGTAKAIATLKPEVDVVVCAPMVENMPGGGSYRQDDILTHYNGKSSEILNTDAEGRLILADALSYANLEYKPDLIIDLATLTGACLYGLGHFYSAVMTNNDKLADKLVEHGKKTGEWLWKMPMHRFYNKAVESKVADVANIGSPTYYAGSITAGKFLEHFIGDTAWAHLDIAGTAMDVPDCAFSKGLSTGVGVRLLVDFLSDMSVQN